jgi:hypothetical protein
MECNFDLYQLQHRCLGLTGRTASRIPTAVTDNRIKYIGLGEPTVTRSDHLQRNPAFDLYQL